jgi:hypothetical protein
MMCQFVSAALDDLPTGGRAYPADLLSFSGLF